MQRKKIIFIVAALLVAVSIGIIVRQIGYSTEGDREASQTPQYAVVLPTNKTIADLGGWQRVSPLESDAVFAYSDNINGIPVSVSQQPLPNLFKSNTDKELAQLAQSYSATNKLDANGIIVYVGTSAKGPQSTIFIKKDLLILIKSQSKIQDDAWISYVNSLDDPINPSVSY